MSAEGERWCHGDLIGVGIRQVEPGKDGVDVSCLREGNGACCPITSDFDPQEPVQGSEISKGIMGMELLLILLN